MDMVVIAISTVICGADSWVAVESFGHAKSKWLSGLLKLPNGIPSHDTFPSAIAGGVNPLWVYCDHRCDGVSPADGSTDC